MVIITLVAAYMVSYMYSVWIAYLWNSREIDRDFYEMATLCMVPGLNLIITIPLGTGMVIEWFHKKRNND